MTATYLRSRLARRLHGHGIEVGPGNAPLTLAEGVTATYVERPYEGDYLDAHGMPGQLADAVVDAHRADLDEEGLGWCADGSLSFVIASHVLEHLANPVRFLREADRVLRPGGRLLLLLPDRERTFDHGRPATPIMHVMEEFTADVRRLDDAHIEAELRHALGLADDLPVPVEEVAKWRELTVHAHCWTSAEFLALMVYATHQGLVRFTLVDGYFAGDQGPEGFEFGLLLEKQEPAHEEGAVQLAQRLLEDYAVAVASASPSEAPRFAACIDALLQSKMLNLPWPTSSDAYLELVLATATDERARAAGTLLVAPVACIEHAAAHASAPLGVGRVAAYWRGVLAGRTG